MDKIHLPKRTDLDLAIDILYHQMRNAKTRALREAYCRRRAELVRQRNKERGL